jgi:hypothetical protein
LRHGIGEFENVPSFGESVEDPRHCNCDGSDEKLEEQARAHERQKAARDEEEKTKMMQEELFFFIHVSTADYR